MAKSYKGVIRQHKEAPQQIRDYFRKPPAWAAFSD